MASTQERLRRASRLYWWIPGAIVLIAYIVPTYIWPTAHGDSRRLLSRTFALAVIVILFGAGWLVARRRD